MAITAQPRSVSDATRFTPTMPHATRRADGAGPGSSARPTSSRFQSPNSGGGNNNNSSGNGSQPPRGGAPPPGGETPAQKVARLRAAHLAAKNAQVSKLDQVINVARRYFDSAHRITIVGLIGFTAIATVLTAYTAVDMMRFNRKRKEEFFAAQRQLEDDELAVARLAYMRGQATPDQTALVEDAIEREKKLAQQGQEGGGGAFKMPSLLGAPATLENEATKATAATTTSTSTSTSISTSTSASTTPTDATTTPPPSSSSSSKSTGVRSWFSSTLSKEEEGEAPGQRRLGYESLSEEDDDKGVRESDIIRALEEKEQKRFATAGTAYIAGQAKAALDRERENERKGGPLDRIGLDAANAPSSGKSWWKFW